MSRHILLVDDQEANLLSLELLVEELDLVCLKARSGQQALEILLDHQDLVAILLDVQMPDMDGFETASLIRKDPALLHIPILFVTANRSSTAYRFKGYESGAVDYLIKPLVPLVVLSKLKVFLELYDKRRILEKNNQELQAQRATLEQLNRYKNVFLSNMSHELRTPLNAILGSTESLQHTDPSRIQHKHIVNIQHSAERLLNMVNQIFKLSRIENDQALLKFEKLSLLAFLQQLQPQLECRAQKKGLVFEMSSHTDLPEIILSDKKHLALVLEHLLDNAFKFTPTGTVSMHLAFTPQHPQKGLLSISIEDSGVGIERSEQESVFEAFVQGQQTIYTDQSLGLGLTFASQIAHLMGGEIRLQSEPGQGSCFTLRLPVEVQGTIQPLTQIISQITTVRTSAPDQALPTPTLPGPWFEQIREACTNSDFDEIAALLAPLENQYPTHFANLQERLEAFDYDALEQILAKWQAAQSSVHS